MQLKYLLVWVFVLQYVNPCGTFYVISQRKGEKGQDM